MEEVPGHILEAQWDLDKANLAQSKLFLEHTHESSSMLTMLIPVLLGYSSHVIFLG